MAQERKLAAHPWVRRCVLALVVLAVGRYYLWAVRASGNKFEWGYDLYGYYDLLGRAFAGRHLYLPIEVNPKLLAQPNPWDPAVDPSLKWHDMVLYGGHYYLYFGAAPAVLVFTPFRLLTGHDLPEGFGIFLICFAGFLFSCGALVRVLELAGVRAGPLLLGWMLLVLGVCQSVPYLLNRVDVYEIAIAGGYLCLSAAIFFLARGLRSRRGWLWMAASGAMFGGAVAGRPHLVFAGVIAAALVAAFYVRTPGLPGALRSRELRGFLLGLALVGCLQAAYNFERFGNPLEFGFRYQLAGPGQNRVEVAARNLEPGLYYMLLSRPEIGPVFPWIRMVFRFPFDSERHPLPPEYFIEPTVGALWTAPFLLAAFLVPRARSVPREARVVLWTAALSCLAVLLFLMSTHLATHRYEVDFVGAGVFAASANIAIYISQSSGWKRRAIGPVAILVTGYSMVANLALGLAGPYDGVLQNRPVTYTRIARWFSPIAEYRPMLDPRMDIEMLARFIPEPTGYREPLVTTGHWHHLHFLLVEHGAGILRFVSKSEDSEMTYDIPDPGARPVAVRMTYDPRTHVVTTSIDSRPAIAHTVKMIVVAPAGVEIGRNTSDRGVAARRFTGTIELLKKSVTP